MSQTLVIEWDRDRLLAATGSANGKAVNIQSAVAVDREGGNLLASELGQNLASALKGAGIEAEEAVVVFPRDLVTFHRVTLPNLGDDEIPDMVRMQAATRLTVPVETVCLDFAPLPSAPDSESREVLLVTLPQQHVDQVKATLAVCNLELKSVRISSFGIAATAVNAGLLSGAADKQSVEVIAALSSDSIEMIFMSGHSIAFSHSGASWTSLEGVEQAVRAEVSRARMAAAEDMGSYSVKRLTLIGSPEISEAVPDTISKRLNDAEVVRVNPEGTLLTGSPSEISASDMLAIAGVIGSHQATSVENIDLINPRRAPEKKDYSRLTKILVTGAVVLTLVGGWKWRDSTVRGYEKQTATINGDIADLQQQYEMAENNLILAANMKKWSDRDINWLDELSKIQELMGGTDRVFIKRFDFHLKSNKHVAAINAEGFAKSRRDIEDLMRVLREAGYEVDPNEITQSLRDPNYNMELRLEVSIPAPSKKTTDKKA